MSRPSPVFLALLLWMGLPSPARSGPFLFEGARSFPVGMWPMALAMGDLNGDGLPELVTADNLGGVSVLAATGDEDGFVLKATLPVDYSVDVALGHLDDDATLDIVAATQGTIAIFLGDGNGTFKEPITYDAPNTRAIAVGDVTGDGLADVVTANYTDNAASVYVGNGDGSVQAPKRVATGTTAFEVAILDLSGDGKSPAFVIANFDDATISLFRYESGDFTRIDYPVGLWPNDIAIGDLDLDGKPDVAVVCFLSHSVMVLMNDGAGGLRPPVADATDEYPASVGIADLNGDAKPDLVTYNDYLSETLSVLLGTGFGTFQPRVDYDVGTTAIGIAMADFDQDATIDLATASTDNNGVLVFQGNGVGGFTTRKTFGVDQGPRFVALADLDGSGLPDMVTANENGNSITVLRNKEDLYFARTDYPVGAGPQAVAIGDLTGEGCADVVSANQRGRTLSVLLGNGDGTLRPGATLGFATGEEPWSVAIADLDHDAKADIVAGIRTASGGGVAVFLGHGDGTFQPRAFYAALGPSFIAVGDVNGDGNADVAAANLGGGVSVLLGDGSGRLQLRYLYPVRGEARGIAMSDLNGDGNQDLAVVDRVANEVSVLLGNGTGAFTKKASYPVSLNPSFVAVGDLTTDGMPDLAVANTAGWLVSILPGAGDGTFYARMDYVAGNPTGVAIGDLNGDHRADLVASNLYTASITFLRMAGGKGGVTITAVEAPPVEAYAPRVAPNPFNPSGSLRYHTARPGSVDLRVFDARGSLVGAVRIPFVPAGAHELGISGRTMGRKPLASGLYFYSLRTADGIARGRFAVLK